jgi:hypothetical protein
MVSSPKKADDSSATKKSLEAQLQYQKNLNSITNRIHSATDTNEILLNLQDEILSFFDADRITVYAVDGIEKEIVSKVKTGDEISEIRVPINKESVAGYCAASGKVVNVPDVYDGEALKGISTQRAGIRRPDIKQRRFLQPPSFTTDTFWALFS